MLILGAGAAGVATASSLLARTPNLDIAIIDPADVHYYQPSWTVVDAGVFRLETTARPMGSVLPDKVCWIKAAVARSSAPRTPSFSKAAGSCLRDDLLRLHGIVHALVNGANCAATSRDVPVVEQIEGVLDQIDHYVAGLLPIRDVLRPLEALRHEDLAGPDHD